MQTRLHSSELLGELVGTNCLGVNRLDRASGLLISELRRMGSAVIQAADATRLNVDGVLCVDRRAFAEYLTTLVEQTGQIELRRTQVEAIAQTGVTVMATGPLTTSPAARSLFTITGHEFRFFYAATEPLFDAAFVDLQATWCQGRFGEGQPQYRNCRLDAGGFERICEMLAETEDSLPVGVDSNQVHRDYVALETLVAHDGVEALTHGPMKPAGLNLPGTNQTPFAVCQMCPDDATGSRLRPVNMRTGLDHRYQQRLFREFIGLQHVEFTRFGRLQRAVYVDAPTLLAPTFQLKCRPQLFLAGAITGLASYTAAAMSGWFAGVGAARLLQGKEPLMPPPQALCGAMSRALVQPSEAAFRPLQATFGMLPRTNGNGGISKKDKRERQLVASTNALARFMEDVELSSINP
jgi:methylenetetrahydrofolate--tRNA-(uracil-5-)-methyltransferase